MAGRRSARARQRFAALLHLPADLVERTRRLFFLSCAASLVLTSATVLPGTHHWTAALGAGAAAVLLASWLHRYLTHRSHLLTDIADVLAVLAFASAGPRPVLAFGVAFPALWFRAGYGRTGPVLAHAIGIASALAAALLIWPLLPGHVATISAPALLGNLPTLLLTACVVRYLVLSIVERERDRDRDTALAALGGQLLGVTDRAAIVRAAWRTAQAVADSTPGLRMAALRAEDGGLRVAASTGGLLAGVPTLPADLLPHPGTSDRPCRVAPPAGVREEWLVIGLPDDPDIHLLLAASPVVPQEALVAARTVLNQVALALRTSRALQELSDRALTDPLTGLANRAAFSAALGAALHDPSHESWVLFLDLDDFKAVNDTLGHLAGDRLLTHLGDALTRTVRAGDVCARLGGDEFAVLLTDITETDARVLGRRLVELIATPVPLPEGIARIGASIGAARLRAGATETQVVHEADLAMYAAKSRGKNRVQFFQPVLDGPDDDRAPSPAEDRSPIPAL